MAEEKTRYMVNPVAPSVAPVILRPVMMQRLGLLFGAENRWVFGDVYIYTVYLSTIMSMSIIGSIIGITVDMSIDGRLCKPIQKWRAPFCGNRNQHVSGCHKHWTWFQNG